MERVRLRTDPALATSVTTEQGDVMHLLLWILVIVVIVVVILALVRR